MGKRSTLPAHPSGRLPDAGGSGRAAAAAPRAAHAIHRALRRRRPPDRASRATLAMCSSAHTTFPTTRGRSATSSASADVFITNPPWRRDVLHPIIVNLSDQAPTWLLLDAGWVHTRQSVPYLPRLRKSSASAG